MRVRLLTPLLLLVGVSAAPPAGPAREVPRAAWDARAAEHLLNRAGFGAGGDEIRRAVELGQRALVDELLAAHAEVEPFYAQHHVSASQRRALLELDEDARRETGAAARREDRIQAGDFAAWWVERMLSGVNPLRERMTLFWHGYFTSSMQDVKNSHEMIRQNELFRTHALGSFRTLLFAVARDPAMLEYLDNDANRRGNPNENFARELLELFTLGEGNYTEQDVKEVARAFTGWTDVDGEFLFRPRLHDTGTKTVLGRSGPFGGDDVLEILLEEDACARHLACALLVYFEGVEPDERRLRRYASLLRRDDYDVGGFLRTLLLDRDFYRDEVVGNRIAGPIDYLVGTSRRLDVEPPGRLVVAAAALLGQRLMHPPSVKGWDGGRAWITTSSLMQRGNLAGVLLGEVEIAAVLGLDRDPPARRAEPEDEAGETTGDALRGAAGDEMAGDEAGAPQPPLLEGLSELRAIERFGWKPRIHLTWRLERRGVRSDAEIVGVLVDELLPVSVDPASRAELVRVLDEARTAAGIEDGRLLASEDAESILRHLAHVLLSLPEAQLL